MKTRLVNENFQTGYARNLLESRGIEHIDDYLEPTSEYLQDPTDLDNMDKAYELFIKTIRANGKMLLVIDSDCDGYTSAAIFYQYTHDIAPNIQIDYLTHEGKVHGLSDHIETIVKNGDKYDLVVLPDSSSNDYEYHEQLKGINLPCLVLDHHLTDIQISDNVIVVNNQLSPNYKNKELTGAGVVYQFCRYCDSRLDTHYADRYIDLAAVGIVGDMGSMLEMENRYIVYTGLKHLVNPFIITILQKQAYSITGDSNATMDTIKKKLGPVTISFNIAPLVNAMTRIGTIEEKRRMFEAFVHGMELIPSQKRGAKGTMDTRASESARECTNAKTHQNNIKESAVEKLKNKIEDHNLTDNRVLFVRLDKDDVFPSTLNGLIAMQLSAEFKKPTIVARLDDKGFISGSARGVNDSELTDFKQFLTDSGLFEYAQGHANAFGLSIANAKLDDFHKYANEALAKYNFGENYYDINFERNINAGDLSRLIFDIGQYDTIWGQGNPQPLVHITPFTATKQDFQVMGKLKDTVKIVKNGVSFIKFKAKDMIEQIMAQEGQFTIEFVGEPGLNEYNGNITPQLNIKSFDIKKGSILDF